MNYCEALDFITKKMSLGIKPGLERIQSLLNALGNPQDELKIIHIAGTNGKGTVGSTIANALQSNGLKVGLFTSPWIIDYREQIQINGEYISEEHFTNIINIFIALNVLENCTEFEIVTAMAYYYFWSEKVDYAVIECGMGGKGDATNVEKRNVCSVLTSISLDHTAFLGSTVEEITKEKEGIIRNSPCFRYTDTGDFNADNLRLAKEVIKFLGYNDNISLAKLPARQQRINGILVDGGHNVNAGAVLAPLLDNEIAVIGMMADKDIDGYMYSVASKCRKIITTTPSNPRALSAEKLMRIAKKYCTDVVALDNPAEAFEYAQNQGLTLVCGSFYLVRDIRNKLI